MKVTIEGGPPKDARDRVLVVEAITKEISQDAGEDETDTLMVLLTAAAHVAATCLEADGDLLSVLAAALGTAIAVAGQFFPPSPSGSTKH